MSTIKMGNTASADYLWTKTFEEIKNKHDEAFLAIDQAISLEERENPIEAIEKYKKGIQLIDKALSIPVQCPDNPDSTWQKACSMIQKIKKTRAEVLMRITCIQSSPNFVSTVSPEDPPSYDEAIASSDEEVPTTYRDLATALNELSFDPNKNMEEDVIYTHDSVRLYFISATGEVLSTQEPQTLKISLVQGNEPNAPKALLQIGSFVYPLVPGVSPCYRTNYGAFILPNVHSAEPGSSVGIILPSDADEEVFDLLEGILHGIISQVTQEEIQEWQKRRAEEPALEDYSTMVSNKIVNGAWYLSRGIIWSAEKTGEFFNKTTPKIIGKLPAAQQPTEVPQPLSKTMQLAETATTKASKVTGFVAEKIGTATMRLGQFLAPHIQRQGTKILSNSFNMPEHEASERVKGILTVAAGAVEGFSTIYRGLETSAVILGSSLKENTVKIVEHKYGQPASNFTGDTLSTMGNMYTISQHARIISPKGLLKKTGKGLVYTNITSDDTAASTSHIYNSKSNTDCSLRKSSSEHSMDGDQLEKKI